jgi:hypothetical protein
MTEEQYTIIYFRDVELNLKAFTAVINCESEIRGIAQRAYDVGYAAASNGEPRTELKQITQMVFVDCGELKHK